MQLSCSLLAGTQGVRLPVMVLGPEQSQTVPEEEPTVTKKKKILASATKKKLAKQKKCTHPLHWRAEKNEEICEN